MVNARKKLDGQQMRIMIEKSMRNKRYMWRTIKGIAKETGLREEDILHKIQENSDMFILSSSRNEKGEELYALRSVYREKASPFRRLSSAITNRGG